jgi:hypothetical protein
MGPDPPARNENPCSDAAWGSKEKTEAGGEEEHPAFRLGIQAEQIVDTKISCCPFREIELRPTISANPPAVAPVAEVPFVVRCAEVRDSSGIMQKE